MMMLDSQHRVDFIQVLHSHALMNEKTLHHRRVQPEGNGCFSVFFYFVNFNHQAFFDEPVNRDESQEYQVH